MEKVTENIMLTIILDIFQICSISFGGDDILWLLVAEDRK